MFEPLITSLVLVAVSEIGDKTQLLSFVLAAKLRRPWPIIAGILVATLLNHTLAAEVGRLLAGQLSAQAIKWGTGLLFIGFGIWALKADEFDGDVKIHPAGAFVTAAIAFFLAEMGDKTQLATATLGARYDNLLQVVSGTTAGMLLADVPAVLLGDRLAHRLPLAQVRYVAAALFVATGLWSILA